MNFANVAFVCVGTPSKEGKLDFTYIDSAIEDIINARDKRNYISIIIKSTVFTWNHLVKNKKNFEKNKKFKFKKELWSWYESRVFKRRSCGRRFYVAR